ncbi:hypothetical protein SSS_05987 [Sarcoptes scabiei]|nr:hypothetical protein SSS_05987 [Sarcoptes scabiei]
MGRDIINRLFGGPYSDTGPSQPRKPNPGMHLPPGVYIPDHKIYKLEDAPELEYVQKRLAARGIKSYWLSRREFGTEAWRIMNLITMGYKFYIPMLFMTAIYEFYLKKDDHHGHSKDPHHH